MYLSVNIFIILAYQCLMICSSDAPIHHYNDIGRGYADDYFEPVSNGQPTRGQVQEDCKLLVPYEDNNMPIPISVNTTVPEIIHPDINGIITIKQFDFFRVVCSNTKFEYPLNFNKSDLTIKCLGKDLLEYDEKMYQWHKFKCTVIPKPSAELTTNNCLHKYTEIKVGFKLNDTFLTTYRICYDMWAKNPLYAWYTVKTPYMERRQISSLRPTFIKTPIYKDLDVDLYYRRQATTVERIIKSRLNTRRYIRKTDGEHLLAKGHLIPIIDFNYAFEQDSTYFYENTSPQWQIFIDGIWSDVEKLFRRNLARAKNSTHLVVSGTYGVATLPDVNKVQQPLILLKPKSLLVPLFYWKMDYDFETQIGVVFIAMNDPYRVISPSVFICETIACPGKLVRRFKTKAVHYCCSKEAFEKSFGEFDDSMFTEV